ncbi:hypothetical protein DYB34_000758 [Aphanomyces astaci]|uniref:FYVE-type domain-containing protein n=2 Tax=Aphanomyces astaci TaxID=112090 RepID=A0A418BZQ6_APHAT|nr:hypothetical protein DYB34_000758 [Aphanomyces astaci]
MTAGVDLNRNFGPIDDNDEDSIVYSESSQKQVNGSSDLAGVLDIHSYGGLILTPFGNSSAAPDQPFGAAFFKLGQRVQSALRNVSGGNYTAIQAFDLYFAQGMFCDFVFATYKVPALVVEIEGADFRVPASTIQRRGREIAAAAVTFAQSLGDWASETNTKKSGTKQSTAAQILAGPWWLCVVFLLTSNIHLRSTIIPTQKLVNIMQKSASIVARARQAVAWNVHTIRWVYLFIGVIFVLASGSPALEAFTAPPPTTLSPQLQLFVTDCKSRCPQKADRFFNCTLQGCPTMCNALQSSYYLQIWPDLPAVCDLQCQLAMPGLCAGTTSCTQVCTDQARVLLQRPTSASSSSALPLIASIRVLTSLGPTFWSTLVLIPLATADILVSIISLGPLLRATDEDIYNNSYSVFSKFVSVLESPAHFLTAATMAFEVKCLMFDDSDGYGLPITVALQIILLAVQTAIPAVLLRLRTGGDEAKRAEVATPQIEGSRLVDGPVTWRLRSDESDLKIFKGYNPASPPGGYLYMGVMDVFATIDEVVDLFRSDSPMHAKQYTQRFGRDLLDMAHLYALAAPSDEDSKMVAVTWRAYKKPVPGVTMKRDACLLECHRDFDVNGRRGRVCAIKSIQVASCPDMETELGLVRMTNYGSGHVFVESDRPGYLQLSFLLHGNVARGSRVENFVGNVLKRKDQLTDKAVTRRCRSVTNIDVWLRENRAARSPSMPEHMWIPPSSRHSCFHCLKGFGAFGRKTNCPKCGHVVCGNCIFKWKVSPSESIQVCSKCSLAVPRGPKASPSARSHPQSDVMSTAAWSCVSGYAKSEDMSRYSDTEVGYLVRF